MKRRIGTLYKIPVVEGDPNEVRGEILIQKDNSTGEISSLQKRISKGYEDVIKLPENVMEVTAFNAEEFELYLVSGPAVSATVTEVRPLTQFIDYTVELDASDLVSGSTGSYSLSFYFIIDKKGTYNVGDTINNSKRFFIVTYSDDDDQPSINPSTINDHRVMSYRGDIDEEENYNFYIMVVVFSGTSANLAFYEPITYYGSLRVHVDTSSLG